MEDIYEIVNYLKSNNYSQKEVINYLKSINLQDNLKMEIIDLFSENQNTNYYSSNDILSDYLKEISVYNNLSQEEIIDLFIKYKNGDINARDKIIKSHLKFVFFIAKHYQKYGVETMDLIEEGNYGLLKAIEKYDYNKGYRFTTYAYYWIRNYIFRALSKKHISVPIRIQVEILKFKKYTSNLTNKLKRTPNNKELIEYINNIDPEFNITEEKIKELENINDKMTPTYLNNTVDGKDNESELINLIEDKNDDIEISIENKIISEKINALLNGEVKSNLNDKELDIIAARYGFYGRIFTLEELGKKYNLTRERIRQIENTALRKLKKLNYIKKITKDYHF